VFIGCTRLPEGCSYQKIVTSTGLRVPAKNRVRFSLDDGHTYLYIGDAEGFSAENNFAPGTSLIVCQPNAEFPYYGIAGTVPGALDGPYRRLK
jgi:hypothetical protein